MRTIPNVRAGYNDGITFNGDGICTDRGRFEGCAAYAVAAYFVALEGYEDDMVCNDAVEWIVDIIYVDDAWRTAYPELADVAVLAVWEQVDGFLACSTFASREEYDTWTRSNELS